MKRWIAWVLTAVLLFSFPTAAYACDKEQTDLYLKQILFGDNYLQYDSDENVKILSSALYLCSIQANGTGANELNFLEYSDLKDVPSLKKINLNENRRLTCQHNAWNYTDARYKNTQKARKDLLHQAADKIFQLGICHETFGFDSQKCDSFSALLYYSHILADYLADDPEETEVRNYHGSDIPAFSGNPSVELNGGKPSFTAKEKKSIEEFAKYSPLDSQGRCGTAFVNVSKSTMPGPNSRENIGAIQPSGWNQKKYQEFVTSQPPYLYNRCHLIAHQLAGNDGKNNLITGTSYLNIEGMKPFEDKVAKYVDETGNHVLYRATPVFKGDNNVVSGVQIEAYSVEDKGKGICFNVYCYNVQPGVDIKYESGANEVSDNILHNNNVLPFYTANGSETNPNLLSEMEKYFEILFENQKGTNEYEQFTDELEQIQKSAESIGTAAFTDAKSYQKLKKVEYDYFYLLKEYVPSLLKNEDFFQKTFYN